MNRLLIAILLSALLAAAGCASHTMPADPAPPLDRSEGPVQQPNDGPVFTADNRLSLPEQYREWIFLSSGLDMSYSEKPDMAMHSMFDNVFVNPSAWKAFQQTGHWPDKTELVMEVRGGESKGSINRRGHFQTEENMGLEAHVLDTSRFKEGWAFFAFDSQQPATRIPVTANCYSCHQQHAAVDTTFVQFYPTLLPIARQKNTLSAD
jgi:hypothetical protein